MFLFCKIILLSYSYFVYLSLLVNIDFLSKMSIFIFLGSVQFFIDILLHTTLAGLAWAGAEGGPVRGIWRSERGSIQPFVSYDGNIFLEIYQIYIYIYIYYLHKW